LNKHIFKPQTNSQNFEANSSKRKLNTETNRIIAIRQISQENIKIQTGNFSSSVAKLFLKKGN
jgi:hypothetical protein